MDALYLLDKDSWREVLDRVNDPADLKACSETCLIFEEILSEKRNAFLFDSILPMIMKYLPAIKHITDKNTSWMVLLDCRLVCRDWCKSIDKLAGSSSFGSLFEYEYRFESGERIEQFLETFGALGGNPIIGRNVTFVLWSPLLMAQLPGDDQNEDEICYITKIREILSRFGNEIQSMQLIQDTDRDWRAMELAELIEDDDDYDKARLRMENSHHLALCKNLQTMFVHLPNLRYLQLPSNQRLDRLSSSGDQEGNMNELSAFFDANPLPPLPHLEGLEILGLNLSMTRAILEKYSSHLKYLMTPWHPTCFIEELPRFRCLKELDLRFLDASESLQCLRELNSPLEKLSLMLMHNKNKLTVWPVEELFQNIQYLPIRKLVIYSLADAFLGESAPISPELRVLNKSISSVDIIRSSGPVSLNILAYCPNLEVFHMFHHSLGRTRPIKHPNGVAELFDVTSLMKQDRYDMYQSNIWGAIPSLKNFVLGDIAVEGFGCRGTSYHRKIYEEKKRKNKKETGCP